MSMLVRSFSTEARPIYVAATRQHVGKTSASLALISGLQKRFDRVGFIKPVGQHCLSVWEKDLHVNMRADKDVVVMRQHFGLDHLPYRYMSPVLIPRGYTRDYVDGKISQDSHEALIRQAYEEISKSSSVVLCEGTGHCAVGSIINASNARVASWLGAEMVLIANGGLGSTFDELELNRVLCEKYNVPIAGVIINKVHPEKYNQTQHYIGTALEKYWGVPLLGCIPDLPFLGCPALADLERLFGGQLISGHDHRLRHYTVKDLNLVATSLSVFLENLRKKPLRTLYVCHISREDILLGFLAEYQRRQHTGEAFEASLIVCGRPDRYSLDPHVLDMVQQGEAPPILLAPFTSREVMEMIHTYTPKLNVDDFDRVSTTVKHYEPLIDFDLLLERTGNHASTKTLAAI
jgi:dethiobiotin synthetase